MVLLGAWPARCTTGINAYADGGRRHMPVGISGLGKLRMPVGIVKPWAYMTYADGFTVTIGIASVGKKIEGTPPDAVRARVSA